MFGRTSKKNLFRQWITLQLTIVEPTEHWLYHDAWCKHQRRDKVQDFSFNLVTLL